MDKLEKVKQRINAQIAVAKEIDSDFITLTVGNGKTILQALEEQRKKGHWIKSKYADDRWHECSECGTITEKVDKNGCKLICNYCRICGADMT